MILLLNGTLGVGKTTVAQHLLWSRPQTVLLECDALCNLNPFDAYDPVRIETLTQVLGTMVALYGRMGYQRFIIDGIFEQPSEVNRLREVLGPGPFHHVVLTARADRRRTNIETRRRDNHLWEVERSEEVQGILTAAFASDPGTRFFDVSDLSVAEVAAAVTME